MTEGITRFHQLGLKNSNEPQIQPGLFLYAQKCFRFSEGCSMGCSAEHHLQAGSSVKPSEGSDLSSRSPMWFIFGVSHKCGSGLPALEQPVRARRPCRLQAMSGCEHSGRDQLTMPWCSPLRAFGPCYEAVPKDERKEPQAPSSLSVCICGI